MGSKPMYAEIGRPDASRSGRPGVVACRIPRHSRSASSPPSPDASSSPTSVVTPASRLATPEPSMVRPDRLGRSFIPRMVSSRPKCRPASGGSAGAGSTTAAAPEGTDPPRSRPRPSRSPSSCSPSSSCWASPGPPHRWRPTRSCRGTSRTRSRRSTTSGSRSRRPSSTGRGQVQLARLGDDRREVVTFADIPPALIDATTSIEDKTFWENSGFDPAGFIAAAIDTIQGRDRGGSTITQQLVRGAPPPLERLRRQHLRAQGQGDHPVDPPDPGLPGRGRQAGDHREVPEPELLRQPELRRRGRRPELLEQGPQGPDARADGDPRRDPPVADPVRPRQERGRGELQGREGRDADAPRRARRPARSSSAATSSST